MESDDEAARRKLRLVRNQDAGPSSERHTDAPGTESQEFSDDPVSLETLLHVMAEFDEFGGASLGLVAWELFVNERAVHDAWNEAVETGLIELAGVEPIYTEELWRLTEAARAGK